jgi:phage terminase large subunit
MGNISDFDWKSPNYTPVWEMRRDRLLKLRSQPDLVVPLKEYYKTRPIEFINDWGCTSDPRNAEIGLPVVVPFLLFPKQEEFIGWLYDRWRGRQKGLVYKSRDMGISWCCVAFAAWMWVFYGDLVIGFGSRKAEYVDKLGDPKSLFWKVREFINNLPPEFRPAEWVDKSMTIINGDNGSVMAGEAGDSIGRGARTSIYFVDESAHLENQESVDAALSATTNCRIDVSTPVSAGGLFERKVAAGKLPLFTFPWQSDPRKDEAWYKRQQEELDPVVLAQEVDLNPMASIANVLLDGSKVAAAMSSDLAPAEGAGPWMIGVDAAHEGNDATVIHSRRGRFNQPQIVIKGATTGDQIAGAVEQHCKTLEAAGGKIGQIVIELDGPGTSVYDFLKLGQYREYVRGIHTGARQKDDRNYNLRAKLWIAAQEYFNEGGVYLAYSDELKQQLCSMLYSFKEGMYLIMSKKEYKKLFKRSPDNADAFVLTFNPYRPKMYTDGNDPFRSYQNSRAGWMGY